MNFVNAYTQTIVVLLLLEFLFPECIASPDANTSVLTCIVIDMFYLTYLSFIYSSVIDEPFVDETRVWYKLKVSILVYMVSVFKTSGSMPLLVEIFRKVFTSPVVSTSY